MRNKLTIPWTARLASGRLFHWARKKDPNQALDHRVLQEDDLDHLGALHSASTDAKKH